MHDFQRAARAHREVFARQNRDDDDETSTGTTARATATASTEPATRTTATTPATTTGTTAPPTTTTSEARTTSTPETTTSSTRTPIIDVSSILGLTTTSSTSSSSSSTETTSTSSSTSATSATVTPTPDTETASSVERQLSTSTATLTTGSASAASATETAVAHSGLSGAATGGIVVGCVLVGLAVLIFAIRKTFMSRRKRKRNTWGAGVYPDINDKYNDGVSDLPPPLPEKTPTSAGFLDARTPVWAPQRPVSPNPPPPPMPAQSYYVTPPQASYNNAMMDAAPAMPPMGAPTGAFGAPAPQGEMAVVRVLYHPTLPDELSITTGEVVQLLKAYDDGWALCSNIRGEQGVVPLECLERNAPGQANRVSVGYGQQETGGDWRNMKRMSSLSTQQPHY